MAWIDVVFFELNRPEYARTPEMLASALAWYLVDDPRRTRGDGAEGQRPIGYVFEKTDNKERRTLQIEQTRPEEQDVEDRWVARLRDAGLTVSDVEPRAYGNSLLDSLRGVTAPNALGRAAVPLVPGTALLQDARGMHAKVSPPNFGAIFNQFYAIGGGGGGVAPASSMWLDAAGTRSSNPLVNVVAEASLQLAGFTDTPPQRRALRQQNTSVPVWLQNADTPFHWFRTAWDRTCSEEWRRALPRRRWADWSTTVLRTAVGMGFLWESRFFLRLVQQCLSSRLEPSEAARQVLSSLDPLLEWKVEETPLGTRDINSRMRRVVIDGIQCRRALEELPEGELTDENLFSGPHGLAKWIKYAREHLSRISSAKKSLSAAFGQQERSIHSNVIETIRYALSCRKEYGPDADLYGLLRTRSQRFRVVQPGPEWIVVVASLAAIVPGATTTLRALRRDLSRLGLIPPREVLVRELERAGLTRSSHDADDAIEVHAGFREVQQ